PSDAMKHALQAPLLADVASRGEEIFQGRLASGLPVRVQVVPRAAYAPALLRATGSTAHVQHLERLARARGVRLEGESEADIYGRLGLPFIPPELREGDGEIEAATTGALPADLVTAEDLKGLVHCHTVYSDGQHTVEQMARAADTLGMEYMTITDHSPAAGRVPRRRGARRGGGRPRGGGDQRRSETAGPGSALAQSRARTRPRLRRIDRRPLGR